MDKGKVLTEILNARKSIRQFDTTKTVSDEVCAQLNRLQRDTVYQKLAMARDHRFPSTLCEMSFISNVEEFQWTLAEGNIERSAQALCDGILKFFQKQQALK